MRSQHERQRLTGHDPAQYLAAPCRRKEVTRGGEDGWHLAATATADNDAPESHAGIVAGDRRAEPADSEQEHPEEHDRLSTKVVRNSTRRQRRQGPGQVGEGQQAADRRQVGGQVLGHVEQEWGHPDRRGLCQEAR